MKPSALLILFICGSIAFPVTAQDLTQTVRGVIKDKDSRSTLPGAAVAIYKDSSLVTGATTDMNGIYRIENVPVGRYTVVASFLGYKQIVIPNVIVGSGKEVIMPLELEESVIKMEEVQITATRNRGEALNEMATVSARTFSVEETERYAGSRGDPARMASNFAGVQGADDSRNDIVIRGNSPLGVLWRVEGVDIPNPNHFSIPGSSGGPVSILNNKVMANSDFFTGAFPAEFGNSISGVFDIKLRNGNNEQREFTGQFGFLGTELTAEGPISKKKRSSYLINYRYSTLAMFGFLGINIGTSAVPGYQDMAFKLNFPVKEKGNISLFGVGGMSNIDILISEQEKPETEMYGDQDRDQYFGTGMGIVGLNYAKSFNSTTFGKFTVATSLDEQQAHHRLVYRHVDSDGFFKNDSLVDNLNYSFRTGKTSLALFVNKKLSARHVVKAGINTDIFRDRKSVV